MSPEEVLSPTVRSLHICYTALNPGANLSLQIAQASFRYHLPNAIATALVEYWEVPWVSLHGFPVDEKSMRRMDLPEGVHARTGIIVADDWRYQRYRHTLTQNVGTSLHPKLRDIYALTAVNLVVELYAEPDSRLESVGTPSKEAVAAAVR